MNTPKLLLPLIIILATASLGFGQAPPSPSTELFIGYSFNVQGRGNVALHGWQLAGAGRFNEWSSLVVDLTGHYTAPAEGSFDGIPLRADIAIYSFRVGPRFDLLRTNRFGVFAQGLLGGNYLLAVVRSQINPNDSADLKSRGFAALVGTGLDFHLNQRVSVRVLQADFNMLRILHNGSYGPRFASGLVVKFD